MIGIDYAYIPGLEYGGYSATTDVYDPVYLTSSSGTLTIIKTPRLDLNNPSKAFITGIKRHIFI